jgi:hypothetical protein
MSQETSLAQLQLGFTALCSGTVISGERCPQAVPVPISPPPPAATALPAALVSNVQMALATVRLRCVAMPHGARLHRYAMSRMRIQSRRACLSNTRALPCR